MNLKLLSIIALTILSVTATVAAITTTPEMMAARRVHQRFAAESFANGAPSGRSPS